MNHEIGGKQWSCVHPAGPHAGPGGGQGVEDVDAWLRRNVRVCSRQEYLRYRSYLAAECLTCQVFDE